MANLDRRAFLALAGSCSVVPFTGTGLAAATCVTSGLPAFTPNRLTVDCASRLNFANYRKNTKYQGLAGVVSMTYVTSKMGAYPAGNMFLFPWLNDAGKALGAAKDWGTVVPVSLSNSVSASPIRGWTMGLDEYFCRYVLLAPVQSFIGFRVDAPFAGADSPTRPWRTNIEKLSDGEPIGIEWTSANLNRSWFGGSQWIPPSDDCQGNAWRKLIIDGLNQASAGRCA